MKRVLQFIILLLLSFVMPAMVLAERIESDLSSTIDIIKKFEIGEVIVTNVGYTRYSNILSTGRAGVLFNGNITNNYVRDVDLELTLNVYNKNKKIIEKRISVVNIPAKGKTVYNQYLYADEIDVKLDDIYYYSLEADIVSDVEILEKGQNDKYYFENYNIIVEVGENNVFFVQESFDAVFNKNVVPLNIGIPFRHTYVRNDGSKVNKRAVISDIVVEDYYSLFTEEGLRYLKIGKEDKESITKNYNFKYTYNVGKDTLKDNDEFVFYLINNLTVKTDGISFKIIMPKEFSEKNIRFIDANGINVENVNYTVKDNVIEGKIDDVINPGISYAISIELEDGYFVNCSSNVSRLTIISFVTPLLFLIIALIVLFVNKHNHKKVTFESIYFNEKLNSLELGYLYSGDIKDSDIASLLFCLANKGYIEIEKSKKNYSIIKKRDYEEDDRLEMAFMNELFLSKDVVSKKELLSSLEDLKDIIVVKLGKKRKNKIYNRKVFNYKLLFWIMICITLVLSITNIFIEYQPSVIVVNCIVTIIGYIILLNSVVSKNSMIEKILYSLVSLILIVSPIVLTSYKAYLQDILYIIIYIVSIISILIIACIASILSDRTKYGNKMLSKISAYKNYLVFCNDEVINKELNDNENCVYEVLPYAMALGISDKWINRFIDKDIIKPIWYSTNEEFDLNNFYLDILNIYSDMFIGLQKKEEIDNSKK
ncbi:MAG: DUF2207 family protein [Candidatus Coprovivens sp.]